MSALAAEPDRNNLTHRVGRAGREGLGVADTSAGGEQRTGSTQCIHPRWLAKETPRQYLSSAAAVLAIVPLATLMGIRFDVAEGMQRYFTHLIYVYAVIMIVSTLVYVPLTLFAFRRLTGLSLRRVAAWSSPRSEAELATQRRRGTGEVAQALGSAFVSLAIVVMLLSSDQLRGDLLLSAAALAGVACSWMLILVSFAVRYLREWALGRLHYDFGDEPPVFSDMVFLSLQMSTAYNLANTQLRSAALRRVATAHNLMAFVFNTVILALLISVALPSLV